MFSKKILFIQPSPKPYYKDKEKNVLYYMSKYFSGNALSSLTSRHSGKMDDINEINDNLPCFSYHLRPQTKLPRVLGIIIEDLFYLVKGIKIYRHEKYDVIVAHANSHTGIIGIILKFLTGAKLIVEIPSHPTKFHTESSRKLSMFSKFSAFTVRRIVNLISNNADMVKLMYDDQMKGFSGFKPKKVRSFFDFVPINSLPKISPDTDEKYFLLVGTPWHLKGVDLLIAAFNDIAEHFPEFRLKIVGKCTEKEIFIEKCKYPERVDLYDQLPNNDVVDLMAKCYAFVLPSRTEGIPRVIQEAMALSRPVIASRVGGIPSIIIDNDNGILVDKEDVSSLSIAMKKVISSPAYAEEMGRKAKEIVLRNFSEDMYTNLYREMVDNL